ncbi:hydrolase [Acidihalobacter ferrooxydans]|uniref:Hydrolase n=1 Tax=Acidihalobacter ferrooxydans TaxID=1765967 RepID=A0A1P8UEK5_9GAMM|nr:hydrolase [Acidihalobacter ferrooxydans]APZ42283.1 hydrolase [Acidihalobacter ferrooxydans]
MRQSFRPAWWLPGPHAQTVWPYVFRPLRSVPLQRERLELPDGDFIDLDWSTQSRHPGLVLVIHGLEGSSQSAYVQRLLRQLERHGLQAVVMHFRGCSGEPNRLQRGYHAGDTADIDYVARQLLLRFPQRPLAAIGYSLGANALLKWLGETGRANPLRGGVAVSVPFELHAAADRLETGFSRIYQHSLLRSLRRTVTRKHALRGFPDPRAELAAARDMRGFDDRFTAPMHGFRDANDYYAQSSCRQWLPKIARKTLIVHAADDPFLNRNVIPTAHELPNNVELLLTEQGGHVGFASGRIPGLARDWLGAYAAHWLAHHLKG